MYLVRAAQVEILADDLLEEHPPGQRTVQHLGQGELGLQDGEVVEVARLLVFSAERVRQAVQPLAQEAIDVAGRQGIADLLGTLGVCTGEQAIVQGGEGYPLLGQLPLEVLVPVEAELHGVGEVGAALQEEGAEVPVDAVEVVVVDQGAGADDPG